MFHRWQVLVGGALSLGYGNSTPAVLRTIAVSAQPEMAKNNKFGGKGSPELAAQTNIETTPGRPKQNAVRGLFVNLP
jgi:hypothetical protein